MDDELLVGVELERIFMPHASARRTTVREQGARFVHYTSAENAAKIIASKTWWLRNARCMNDYMEVSHGHQLLQEIFRTEKHIKNFHDTLSAFGADFGQSVINAYNQWWNNIQNNTFISSISEHDKSEDEHGRLSMWRAYGGNSAKTAIVINLPLQPGAAKGLRLLVSPVSYFSYKQFQDEFEAALESIRSNLDYVKGVKIELVQNMALFMLIMGRKAHLCENVR
jgi:hypothetical protein